jgi:outer membrane protein TolC
MFGDTRSYSYRSNPVTVTFRQSLFGYNSLKWEKKVEPLRYQEAKRNYVARLEQIALSATNYFFSLARAQTNLSIAKINYANADTLYTFAKGRYDIGTITENEMLQLEIKLLTEESNMLDAQIYVDDGMQSLLYFLGITDRQKIEVIIEEQVPEFVVNLSDALQMALDNSPDILKWKRSLLSSESDVAYRKSLAGLQANLVAQLGLTQTGHELNETYKDPINQQYVSVGISIPILDWGRRRGSIRLAQSNHELVKTNVEQEKVDFEVNITKKVKQFNLQANRVLVAAKADQIADRRNEIARRLYILGQSTILDLNSAITEKDGAKRNYISSLSEYWSLYYTLRILTLYDFEKHIPITEDFELLLK